KEDDVQLVRKILSGDDAAFGILVEKYQKSVHTLVWRKIGDYHHAEDIMQDAFYQAYKKLSTLKDPNQFAGWLYVIANRLCIDWMRKQKWMREQKFVMQSLEDTRPEEIERSSYTHHVSEQSRTESTEHSHALVKKLLEKLPESERTVVMLYYLDEMPTKEISKFLGVSANTIASRLHRARKRLQVDQELLVQEVLDDVQLSENLKENTMSQLESIRSKFDSFIAQAKSDPTSGEDILKEAHIQVEDALKGEITPDLAHLADEIYEYIGKIGMEKSVSLHRRYLNVASDNKERFWSHRQLSGNLARLQRNTEAVEEQVRLYRWTCEHLSDEDVLEAVNSLSHIRCWEAEGRVDEWFQLYEEASERLENPELSRYARCDFLQIGSEILRAYDRLDETLLGMEKLEDANGEPSWEHYFRFWLAVRTNRLLVYSKQEDWERFDQTLTEVSTFIEGELEKRAAGHSVNISDLTWAAHDVGYCLLWSKRYNEARHFLQIAIDLIRYDAHTHFFLAVSVWASEKDREKTLHHLKATQDYVLNPNRDMYYSNFLETPEFSDVKDDQEFLKALGQK
ncbi:sigma-70 family RNA polymerase sigma factor, partial [Candidatus Poribacteria bacterium]|nr:sigma-70 family RNA polymerase sigma factor [Candidatus Poribacteria bacterium]